MVNQGWHLAIYLNEKDVILSNGGNLDTCFRRDDKLNLAGMTQNRIAS
ncbi:hypothetical protein [Candidatus Tisiphia endosymbiont of Hybos culiciformis]